MAAVEATVDHDYPILEHDSERKAIIEPGRLIKPLDSMPERCVVCFFQQVIADVCGNGSVQPIKHLGSEIGKNPVYVLDVPPEKEIDTSGQIAVVHPGVGAPLSAAILEEMIALGCRKFIACGGAGVLNREIAVGHLVVPVAAVRDEGTSYHYLPPSREVAASELGVAAIQATLDAHEIPYVVGKTWTTDAVYRETPAKIARRREEGCVTVEMEAAAFFAVAQFRSVEFAQILYGGDDISGDVWDHRNWMGQTSTRERMFWLAAESVLRM